MGPEQECLQVEGDAECPPALEAAAWLVTQDECLEIVSVDGDAVRTNADTGDNGWTPPRYNCCYPCTERDICGR